MWNKNKNNYDNNNNNNDNYQGSYKYFSFSWEGALKESDTNSIIDSVTLQHLAKEWRIEKEIEKIKDRFDNGMI